MWLCTRVRVCACMCYTMMLTAHICHNAFLHILIHFLVHSFPFAADVSIFNVLPLRKKKKIKHGSRLPMDAIPTSTALVHSNELDKTFV